MAVLAVTAVSLVGALLLHLTMIFLTVAPFNAVKARNGEVVQAYVQPEFGQDWKLFAPNPKQRNDAIDARLRTVGEGGGRRVSEWINNTAQDVQAIQGSLAPSHVHPGHGAQGLGRGGEAAELGRPTEGCPR